MTEQSWMLLRQLVSAYGVSGEESEIRELLRREAEPFADEVKEDALGNLIVHRRGEGERVLFSAHMDSVGVMVQHIDEKGYLRFGEVGGLEAAYLCMAPVRFRNGTLGVIALNEGKEGKEFSLTDLYIDIGAKSREEAEKLVSVGDTAVYAAPTLALAGGRILSPYLDNRAGCFVLLEALRRLEASPYDLYFLFSVQEEVGCRGAKPAAWTVNPHTAIAVDVTCPDDLPNAIHDGTTALGKGAGIKIMDHSAICSPALVRILRETAERAGIPVQSDIMKTGGTDAGSMQTAGAGAVTGGITIPCRYTHTPAELLDLDDLEACIRLVQAFCEGA